MNRRLCSLLCLILLCTVICSCSQDRSPNYNTPPINEPTPPYILELMKSYPEATVQLPDEVLYEADEFIYYRENGVCYISFHSGNNRIEHDEKDAPSYAPVFQSMEEKYQWFCAPKISADHEATIRSSCTLVEGKGFVFQDRDLLYTAELPGEYRLDRTAIVNSLVFTTHERLESGRYGGCHLAVISKKSFTSHLISFYRFQLGKVAYDTSYSFEEKNATVYEYETEFGKRRYVQYRVQAGAQTYFIEEYRGDSYSDRVGPIVNELYSVKIFGYDNGIYFSMGVFYSDPEPLIELVGNIKIVKYTQ